VALRYARLMRMVSLVAVVSLASCGQPKTAAEENRPADACDDVCAVGS